MKAGIPFESIKGMTDVEVTEYLTIVQELAAKEKEEMERQRG